MTIGAEARAPVFEIRGASKYFGGVTAVSDVSLGVYASEIVAIVGGNGAGKSTLIKAISGRSTLQTLLRNTVASHRSLTAHQPRNRRWSHRWVV
ncbi:MAG: ATP-binding cassette domain-containing protein [Hyphomicrobiales bacterium]|nr:ATP-binding cassette domain-containing protein [Hyphomicrobiales bacterium]